MAWNYWPQYINTGYDSAMGRYGDWQTPLKGLPELYSMTPKFHILEPPGVADLISRALASMTPGISPAKNVSALNSLYELKDVTTLRGTYQRIRDAFRLNQPVLRALLEMRKNPASTLRKLLRAGADSYLQAEFNVLPLLSDIAAVRQAISDTRNQLRELIKRAGSRQKRHHKVPLSDFYVNNISQGYDNLAAGYRRRKNLWSRTVTYTKREFNITLEYAYKLPDWVSEDSLLQAFEDRIGANLNPRIIWNAIPWSFTVDWVLGIGQWLDQFKIRSIEPLLSIASACYSITVTRVVTTTNGWDSADPCMEVTEEAYTRQLVPSLYNSLVASGLSPKELSLTGALAATR